MICQYIDTLLSASISNQQRGSGGVCPGVVLVGREACGSAGGIR